MARLNFDKKCFMKANAGLAWLATYLEHAKVIKASRSSQKDGCRSSFAVHKTCFHDPSTRSRQDDNFVACDRY